MPEETSNPFSELHRAFHEPKRLQILSVLAATAHGLTFNELKEKTGLTDGNLSRHLKMLEQARTLRIEKTFVNAKPRTTVFLSDEGRESFLTYLKKLEEVLVQAHKATGQTATSPSSEKPDTNNPRERFGHA
jgi:DNA-binding transcriptional ArsR family regulator